MSMARDLKRVWLAVLATSLIVPAIGAVPAWAHAAHQETTCSMPFESVSDPLPQLAAATYTRMDGVQTAFTGGLYPDGSDTPPPGHLQAALARASAVAPLDADGIPDPVAGQIGFISIGMSNTGQEFGAFQGLLRDQSGLNPALNIVNGGVGGRTAENWIDPGSDAWEELGRRLEHFGLSPMQVQVAWIKLTLVRGGEFPEKAIDLQQHLEGIVQMLKTRFPNLSLAYISSRTRSYTYWRGLSPEPVAFETGFAVKWLIQDQIEGKASLNFDSNLGEVRAPILLWGPYLWTDGEIPRVDGMVWLAEDMTADCTHPSSSGRTKIARLLLDFFMNDPTASAWFLESEMSEVPPELSEQTQTAPPDLPTPLSTAADTPTEALAAAATPELRPTSTATGPTAANSPTAPIAIGLIVSVVSVAAFAVLRRVSVRR